MENVVKLPRKKCGAPPKAVHPFPVPTGERTGGQGDREWYHYKGYLSGDRVFVEHTGDALMIYKMGFFGKGTLSKHEPTFHNIQANDRFDLQSHVRKITDKVYMRRTFTGSLKAGCQRPGQMMSARALSRNQPFSETGIGPSSTRTKTTLPSASGLWSSANHTIAALGAGADSDDRALPRELRSLWHDGRTKQSSHDAVSVEVCAGDAWEGAEADADFWLGSLNGQCSVSVPECENAGQCASAADDGSAGHAAAAVPAVAKGRDSTRDASPSLITHGDSKTSFVKGADLAGVHCLPGHDNVGLAAKRDHSAMSLVESNDGLAQRPIAKRQKLYAPSSARALEHENVPSLERRKCKWAEESSCDGRDEDCVILHEHLELLLEEAFFLAYGLGCLLVSTSCAGEGPDELESSCLQLVPLWQTMRTREARFVPRYVAYHHLRSRGWVPRDGLRFGVDFVVYKSGPPYYHASYSLIVMAVDADSLEPSPAFPPGRSWTWSSLACANRVTEAVNKELMICNVLVPAGLTDKQLDSPECLGSFQVHYVVVERMVSSKERELETAGGDVP